MKNKVTAEILKKTFIKVIQEKMATGTLLFSVSFFDKARKSIGFYQETMEINIDKTVEGVDFIYCNMVGNQGGNIIRFIIGVNSLTGVGDQIEDRFELAVAYFFYFKKIKLYRGLEKIATEEDLIREFSDFKSVSGKTSNYYSRDRELNLDLITNIQEILFMRNLMTFSTDEPLKFRAINERIKFDEISLVNMINHYMVVNNLFLSNDNKSYKNKFDSNKNEIVYFSDISFITNNLYDILYAVKSEFRGQLNNLNINNLLLEFGPKLNEILKSNPNILVTGFLHTK